MCGGTLDGSGVGMGLASFLPPAFLRGFVTSRYGFARLCLDSRRPCASFLDVKVCCRSCRALNEEKAHYCNRCGEKV